MKKILVPVDGSALSEQAIPVVEAMLDQEVEVIFARVLNPLALAAGSFVREEVKDYLNDLCENFQKKHPKAKVSCRPLEGTVADSLLDLAEAEHVGLIVTTTHGSSGLGRWLMGSVAEKLVRHAPCPVLSIGRRTLEQSGAGESE